MGEEQVRLNVTCQRLQVTVVPCRLHVFIDTGLHLLPIPAYTKAIPIRRIGALCGMEALIDQRILGLENNLIQIDWST